MMKREGRHSLRIQVEGLKQQVTEMGRDLEDKTVLMQETEASLRSEVRLIIPGNSSTKPAAASAAANAPPTVKHSCSNRKSVSRSLTKIEIGEAAAQVTSPSESTPPQPQPAAAAVKEDVKNEETHPEPSPLVRYKSLRDQEGKFSLVVKIR